MKYLSFLVLAALLTGVAGPARAIDQSNVAPVGGSAASAQPEAFSLPLVLFVAAKPAEYGLYTARQTNHFKAGEAVLFYAEPKNFKYQEQGGLFTFGFVADIYLIHHDDVIFGKENFMNYAVQSHHQNKEFMIDGHLNITGAPAGNYILKFVVHDRIGNESAEARLPFVID